MNSDRRSRYDLAVTVARKAGDLAKAVFDSTFEVEWKQDQSPVTAADRDAEALIREAVAKHFPGDGFVGEEFGDVPSSTGFRWVVDPIDGTKSFVRRIPLWGTLVGLEYRGEQIAGVCYAPGLNQLWRALRGDGAYRDETRVRVSDVGELKQAMVCYSSVSWFRRHGKEAAFLDLVEKTDRPRAYGDFYGFVLLAQGSCEVMVDCGLHPWDAVAPKAVVEEAGGRFTDWAGTPTAYEPNVIASNGRLHDAVLAILTK